MLMVWVLGLALLWGSAFADSPRIVVLKAKGPVNPVLANYFSRGVTMAETQGASMVVLQMDTPGGLDSAMRDIVQRINSARIPVVIYVSPSGARAASAGAFITMAAHVAAMAPNTAIGAAHPVAGGPQELTGPMADKVTNDAVAYIRGIAELRGRNPEWAEKAVRESISSTAEEAVRDKVVDLVAVDLDTLLSWMDGKQVKLMTGEVILSTKGRVLDVEDMNFIESFLFAISDPNIAYILLTLAMTGIFLELSNPGAILPGIVGGIALFMSLFALGMLPINISGLFLIALGFLLFVVELWVSAHGMLSIGGTISLALGSLLLISSNAPYLVVDRRLIATVVVSMASFFFFAVGAIVRTQRQKSVTGREGLMGMVGVARTPLSPEGTVFVHGERWLAVVEDWESPVAEGERVKIISIEGLKLKVTKES